MVTDERFRALGEELKRARIARNRSLDDIAAQTKIHRRHLEAIEAGDLARLPQGPYVKAFVRELARAVGVDVPTEFAHFTGASGRSPKDPKVVSHTAGEKAAPISEVARETARFANTAMRTAVKSVTKTTENVVQMVESGGKEAFEALTSKDLWNEAENVRRERHGLPPVPVEQTENPLAPPAITPDEQLPRVRRAISKRATNVVIALLAILFAGAIFFAIRMSRNEGADTTAGKGDYVPAPVESPAPRPNTKPSTPTSNPATAQHLPAVKDSLHFTLHATQPVWVSIAPDGVPAYRGQLKAGETRAFRAVDKIVLDIGNQNFVEMQLDGQRLTKLPTIQNSSVVIRNLVLTKTRASLGGKELDLKKPTSATPPTASVARTSIAPAVPKSTTSKSKVLAEPASKAAAKPLAKAPSIRGKQPAKPAVVKKPTAKTETAASKAKSEKVKKPHVPAVELRSVEPIPPGP